MKTEEFYHIVIATDDNYAIHARTLIHSVLDNEIHPLHFHIISFDLSEENTEKFKSLRSDRLQMSFIAMSTKDIQERLFSNKTLEGDRSLATYARLLIPEIIDQNINRCVYLDVDGLILNSMAPMYEINLDDYPIAGVIDTNPISRHIAVGLDKKDVYINAGMIIWNLNYCRSHNVVDQFAEFIQNKKGKVDAMDQGTINGVLSKYIKPLPPCFNALTTFFQLSNSQIKILYGGELRDELEIEEARKNPIFVHFTPNNTTRPWIKNCRHPLRSFYWKYREDNDKIILQEDKRNIKLKILSLLFYLLPIRVYSFFVKLR